MIYKQIEGLLLGLPQCSILYSIYSVLFVLKKNYFLIIIIIFLAFGRFGAIVQNNTTIQNGRKNVTRTFVPTFERADSMYIIIQKYVYKSYLILLFYVLYLNKIFSKLLKIMI